ncbi:PTS sugar transporter subunit IIC [Lactobacillus psittaci]|uniref:Cellobiose-specific PTS IIC n=1 Tax=Lactobacillus psittaci DSM 15354 TaxID=1122152 RepID=A0A0R1S679_9LACO|nr:PTS sugar transporter subunit IIC [Lactobacillus psittaci]KRL63012.1 cellobiose-specific PTS IIC [Lactobacillus psittaci DSM 15354]
MEQKLVKLLLRMRERVFFRAAQRTFAMIMPFALIGAFFQMFSKILLSHDSLFFNILNLGKVFPRAFFQVARFASNGVIFAIFSLFGVYAAYFMALYTARIYNKDSKLAGITAIIAIFFIRNPGVNNEFGTINLQLLSIKRMFVTLLIGYLVGQVYHFLGQDHTQKRMEHVSDIKERAFAAIKPITASLLMAIIVAILIYILQVKIFNSNIVTILADKLITSNNLLINVPLVLLAIFLHWLGIGTPLELAMSGQNGGAATANFNYALTHGSSWNVPFKYLGSNLVQSYGTLSGAAFTVSLIIAVLLLDKSRQNKLIAKASIFPALFGAFNGFWVAFPIYLNPLLVLPVLVIPLVNIVISSLAIALHLIPVSVYPVLAGTPGVLIPYIGTNGSWQALVMTIALVVLDIYIVMPFYKINMNVQKRIAEIDTLQDSRVISFKGRKKIIKEELGNNEKTHAQKATK